MSTLPNAAFSISLDCQLDNVPGTLGRLCTAIGEAGGNIGALVNVKAGPIQITTPDSTMTADYGAYDTSTIEKTVTATVSVTFKS